MENKSNSASDEVFEFDRQLKLLKSGRKAAIVEGRLPTETPMWHAPALSTALGLYVVWDLQPSIWASLGLFVAVVILICGIVGNYQRRTVKLGASHMGVSIRGLGVTILMILASFLSVSVWFLGLRDGNALRLWAVPLVWFISTVMQAVGIYALNRWRKNVIERNS